MKYIYLRSSWSAMLIRYSVIFFPLLLSIVFGGKFVFLKPFIEYFWFIAVVLMFAERYLSNVALSPDRLIFRFIFFEKVIQISSITAISEGTHEGMIAKPRAFQIKFTDERGIEDSRYLVAHLYNRRDLREFVTNIQKYNPKIEGIQNRV